MYISTAEFIYYLFYSIADTGNLWALSKVISAYHIDSCLHVVMML